MGTQIKTWEIVNGELRPVDTSLAQQGRTEPYDLEAWIASDPSLVGSDLRIIGRQVHTDSGPLDLLAIDRFGNLVVVELKRDKLPREALTQAIDYASDVSDWTFERISEVCLKFNGKSLDDFISEEFPGLDLENLNINEGQRVVLVGFAIDSALERMVYWLSDSFGMSINAILLNYAKTTSGDEVISRSAVISEQVGADRRGRGPSPIPMSDEPGNYGADELHTALEIYFSQKLVTVDRMKQLFLPMLLQHQRVTRNQLKDEFVKQGLADDQFKAGIYLTLISSQMGMKKNDFLRQIIGYEYPNYAWEKDNYFLREGGRAIVEDLLAEETPAATVESSESVGTT